MCLLSSRLRALCSQPFFLWRSPSGLRSSGLAAAASVYNDRVDSDVERRLRAFFSNAPDDLAAVYLFGSVARGTEGPDSDVDVGILFRTDPPATLDGLPLDLEDALERSLGKAVQVVTLNHAPADLRARVLRDGRLIVQPDPGARVRWEVATRNEVFDLQPILTRYRRGRPAEQP